MTPQTGGRSPTDEGEIVAGGDCGAVWSREARSQRSDTG